MSIKTKRLKAAWDNRYLLKLLNFLMRLPWGQIKIGLFLMMLLFSFKLIAKINSTETTTETKIITFHVTTSMKKLLHLNLYELEYGLRANTQGGKVEVRLYAGYGYNYNHDRKNPNLLYGFTSSESDGLAYQQSSFILEGYWPAICLGGFNPLCLRGDTSFVNVLSTDLKKFKAKILRNYNQYNATPDGSDSWIDVGNQTMQLIVEISYSLPKEYSEFQYSLKLPGLVEMNQIEVAELLRTQLGDFPPPFAHYTFAIPDYIATTFKSIKQKEDTNYVTNPLLVDRERGYYAYNFDARYDDNQIIGIMVIKDKQKNQGSFTADEAKNIASDIAGRIGKIPVIARKGFSLVRVFDGYISVFGDSGAQAVNSSLDFFENNIPSIFIPAAVPNDEFYNMDSLLFHEIIHTNIGSNIYSDVAFQTARLLDRTYISNYALSSSHEVITESFPAWVKLRYFPDLNVENNSKIMDAIPGTIAYFDTHIKDEDLRPIPTNTFQSPVDHEIFSLAYPLNEANFIIGTPITFRVEKMGGTSVTGVSDAVSLELYANEIKIGTISTSNSDIINFELTPSNWKGAHEITGRVNYKDGYKSHIGIINIHVVESLPSGGKIISPKINPKMLSSESSENNTLKLYPNPSNGQFEIEFFVETYGNVECQIVDLQGRLIVEQKKFFERGQQHWLIDYKGKLAKGTYILAIKGMNKSESKLIIIE